MPEFQPLRLKPLAGACLLAWAAIPAVAQTAPDTGRVLQEQTMPVPQAPRPSQGLRVVTPPNPPTLPGGASVVLQAVRVTGNTSLPETQLLAALGPVTGQSFDMAGLRGLAERVTTTYEQAGYPFARAFLPPQELSSGQLTIEVVEGRYDEVKATGDARLVPSAQGMLSLLRPGEPIASATLERATLLLEDLPGIRTTTVLRPGKAFGTGALEVNVQHAERYSGEVGYDNHGSRYTGEHRLRANLQVDSPFVLGDQIQVRAIYTSEHLWLGSVAYSLPLGNDGWRGQVGYAHTRYELGKEFSSAEASGTAKVYTLGASYPWVRSQALNLTAGLTLQYKDLLDKQGAAGTHSDKSSQTMPVSLRFDLRDGLGGGGVNYGSLSFTPGRLNLDAQLQAEDTSSGVNTRGSFSKWNLDVARVQATPVAGLTLFGRLSGQWASKNLDSSERFGLGGPTAVRAFPGGEGFGDEGWLAQMEARYAMGAFVPYAFYDGGAVRINARPVDGAADKRRAVAGAGLGVRYQQGQWAGDLMMAWRTKGGRPEADTTNRNPQVWLTAQYRF